MCLRRHPEPSGALLLLVVAGKENAEERGGGCREAMLREARQAHPRHFIFRILRTRIELLGSVKRVFHGILRLESPRLNPSTRGASETEYEWNVADRCKFSGNFFIRPLACER